MSIASVFQSTRPRGTRHVTARAVALTKGFNPRAHGGRDGIAPKVNPPLLVSIHAPTGDATATSQMSVLKFKFQSTRPRGTRRASVNIFAY